MVRLIPFFVLSEHCIQDGQQFAHIGNQHYVQRSSHTRPTTEDGSSASHRARIPVYWGNAHESANPSA